MLGRSKGGDTDTDVFLSTWPDSSHFGKRLRIWFQIILTKPFIINPRLSFNDVWYWKHGKMVVQGGGGGGKAIRFNYQKPLILDSRLGCCFWRYALNIL